MLGLKLSLALSELGACCLYLRNSLKQALLSTQALLLLDLQIINYLSQLVHLLLSESHPTLLFPFVVLISPHQLLKTLLEPRHFLSYRLL